MSFTPQRAGPSKVAAVSTPPAAPGHKSVSTPTSQWSSASPQTIAPARASSALLPSPPKDSSPRSRWTEHIIPEDSEDMGVKRSHSSRSGLGISEPLARMGRSSLPAPFDLSDPRDDEQDETVRPAVGRQATNRAVRIIQQPPTNSHLQVPPQSYSQPESRGTTPMPLRPSSQLGLITYGGRPRIPRFHAPGLDLKLTRDSSSWSFLVWRIGLPIQLFAPVLVQLFLDFCSVYVVVQAAAEPTYGRISNRQNWSLAAAAYCACVAVWIIGIVIVYELVYCFWRRWRIKRPAITPLYLSTPGRHYASLASYDVFCFFRSIQRAEIDYVPEDDVPGLDREGAKGRAGNRSMLSSRFGTSADLLSGHRRSDSGGELLQIASPTAEASGVEKEGARAEGVRRRSVGRAAGEDLVGIQTPVESKHTRSPSTQTQTRFQELVYGPGQPPRHAHKRSMSHGGSEKENRSLSGPKSSKHRRSLSGPFTHRRSMSGRTSSEVERALDLTPVASRRVVSGSSYGSSSVGFVLGCLRIFLSPTSSNRSELWYAAKHRLAEFCYSRTQSFPTLLTLLPRAGIAGASLFAFWNPPVGGGGLGVQFRDGAFFNSNGTLTGFSRGTLLANVALTLFRLMLVMTSLLGLWVLSGQGCAGLCGPRYRWEEEGEWDEKGPIPERDELGWEWRTHVRERIQDAYELCTVRRQSWIPQPTPQPHLQPLPSTEKDKGKQPEHTLHHTHRPTIDTFGSTFGAGVVRERNSDQELALSVPSNAEKGNRRALSVEMFEPSGEEIKNVTGRLVPPVSTTANPATSLPFPLQPSSTATTPRTMPLVLQSPLVAAVRQREMSSSAGSGTAGSSTARGASTPRTGPSTSTLGQSMTPRAATKLELESVSSQEVVEERDEEEKSVTVSYDDDEDEEDKDRSFTLSGEHSGDRSYDSYADNFSVGDYAGSQGGSGSVRIRAAPPPGSEADTSGSYSENFDTTSASLSSLGQPISTRFFPISFPRPSSGYSPGGNSGSNGHHTDSHRSRRSAYSSQIESPRPRRSSAQDSLLSHGPDSILSHGPDSIVSHSHGSTASLAQDDSLLTTSRHDDSIMSLAQDSMISSPSRSQRSGSTGLIPPPPHNPNQRRRRAGTAPSVISAESIESLAALRRRVESHTVRPGIPAEFGGLSDEGFEAEREDSVGMLSAPSSRKNSLVAMNQRARRGRVASGSAGSGSAGSRGSASGGSRAVSGASGGSRAVSGSSGMSGSAGSRAVSGASRTTGSGGSVMHGQSEDEGQDHTFGVGTSMWRRGATPLRQRHDSGEAEPPVPERPDLHADLDPTSSTSTEGTSTRPFPRHSIATSSTSANPEASTVAGSFVTAPPSFVSASETEQE
ncbi:transmembrane protein, putative [Rhizoctonia solani AG-3 Rhs1AP]|uniref:Transmembrane protein, putative n=1 Tax=Rhizoctonia solani AG-3 Rhs1AP TaxID=1086054 RepID=A0A0A1UIP8_9AGAM|nr:transmembrane protein, putative [Rhizoctonia solani AG-3 Rhs1AP]